MTHHRIDSRLRAAAVGLTAVVTVAIGSVAASAGSSAPHPVPPVGLGRVAGPGDGEIGMNPEAPIWVRTREHRRLCHLAAAMPSEWPATAAIRRQADQPLGDPGERDRWHRDAERLPSYWPAAQMMGAAAEERLGCSFWNAD